MYEKLVVYLQEKWHQQSYMKTILVACIAQLKEEYIKGDKMKHILPKLFFTHDLQRNGNIIIQ